ncbi:hypothetical protein HZA98_02385 [Candidatus Woesearchaeota archaeon]|nr:hypothetical protein [Candidatus Woesearchaeota archaeon]
MNKKVVLLLLLLFVAACTSQKIDSTLKDISNNSNPIQEEVQDNTNTIQDNPNIYQGEEGFELPADTDKNGWTQTLGPLGGTVIRMLPHEGTVWASLYSGGIYELQNDDTWKQIAIGKGIPEVRAFDIVIDPSNTKTVYVPEMIACGAETTDDGVSWHGLCEKMLKDIDAPNFNSHTLALDPEDPKIVYLPGHTHDQTSMLLVSMDAGENWEKRFIFDKHYDFNHLVFFKSKMYLGTENDGIFVSSDKGKTWEQLNTGLENLQTARFVVFKNNLYLQGSLIQFNVRMGGSLYKLSTDASSWEKISSLEQVTGMGADENSLLIGTWNGAESKLHISTDGVSFREAASNNLPTGDWLGEMVSLNGKIYASAGGNGIYISSDNGENFEEFNDGLISIATREVHVNPNDGNEIYVGTWDRFGFYWSKNAGKAYKRIATDYSILTLQPNPQDFSQVYIAGDRFAVGKVSEQGFQFIEKNKPGTQSSFVKSLAIDPRNANHILAGVADEVAETPPGEGLWETEDGGGSWTRANGIGNFAVYSIIFNPTDSSIVYASALGGGVFKSTDAGSNFSPLGGDQLKYTYRLAMSPTNPNILIASSNVFFAQLSTEDQISGKYGGIFQTKDAGATWKELTAGIRKYGEDGPEDFKGWLYNFGHLPNYEMVLIDPENPDHLIVGHHGENVIETTDGGQTWQKSGINDMVPGGVHNYAYCLDASSDFKKIYSCTCGRGLFKGVLHGADNLLSLTGNVIYNGEEGQQVNNVAEARELLLSGEYNHPH